MGKKRQNKTKGYPPIDIRETLMPNLAVRMIAERIYGFV